MNQFNVFKLCKAIFTFIQETTEKMKKDNQIRLQIIRLSIERKETSSLYKDVTPPPPHHHQAFTFTFHLCFFICFLFLFFFFFIA